MSKYQIAVVVTVEAPTYEQAQALVEAGKFDCSGFITAEMPCYEHDNCCDICEGEHDDCEGQRVIYLHSETHLYQTD